jgi:hypothetical protein
VEAPSPPRSPSRPITARAHRRRPHSRLEDVPAAVVRKLFRLGIDASPEREPAPRFPRITGRSTGDTPPSNLILNHPLNRSDRGFVAAIHRPLPDPFGAHQFRRDQDAHVLAQRGRADAELFRNQKAAHAVVDQVAVDLFAKMLLRIAKPVQDQKAALVGQSAQRDRNFHLAILLIN